MSMRVTMSNDVVLEEVYLPEERAPIFNRPVPGEPRDASVPAALPGGKSRLRKGGYRINHAGGCSSCP